MTTASANPFRPTRWEHHSGGTPLIWFTPTAQLLSEDKSTYVHGSRGSGKTTLLKSICWDDLLHNHSLTLQRNLSDFRHLGIYIRLPDHVAGSLGGNDWAQLFPEAPDWRLEFLRFFSLAVELICAEKALAAVHTLRMEGKLELKASQELSLVLSTIDEFGQLREFAQHPTRTFVDLSRLFRDVVRAMNEASGRGLMADLMPKLPTREPGEILSYVAERLSGITRIRNSFGGVSPGFKFCLDDCEVLSHLQMMTINTLVRKSRFPISWVICSVGDTLDSYDTFIMRQPLTDADRRVISLDGRAAKEFYDLCQAVASMRVYYAIPEDRRPGVDRSQISAFFSLDDRLGNSSVNGIVGQIVSRATSVYAHELQEATLALRSVLQRRAKRYGSKFLGDGAVLPYYEAYLLWHWDGLEDSFSRSPDRSDFVRLWKHAGKLSNPSFQAWMRRKMVAAMLQIASKLGFRRLPLSGANIVVSLADGSIRDFLEIMGEIFDKFASERLAALDDVGLLAERFAVSRSRVSLKTQSDGIYASSEAFFKGISAQSDARPDAVSRLVEGLGEFTRILQSSAQDTAVLSTAERGVFVFDESRGMSPDQQVLINQTIHRAELSGYLRSSQVSRKSVSATDIGRIKITGYRLHRRFSPYFHFSYRGAYEVVHLAEEQVARLCMGLNEVSPVDWAKSIASRISIEKSSQLTLFADSDLFDD